MIEDLYKGLKNEEKDIPQEKLKEYKRKAAVLAAAHGMERKRCCWWVEVNDDVRLIIHEPTDNILAWLRDRINNKEEKE